MAELTESTDQQIISELLSRSSTVGDYTTQFGVVEITKGVGGERDQAVPTFHASIGVRRAIDLLGIVRERLETP